MRKTQTIAELPSVREKRCCLNWKIKDAILVAEVIKKVGISTLEFPKL